MLVTVFTLYSPVPLLFPVDLHRTFPDNIHFRKSADPCLQKALFNVLVAYGHHNKAVGYCQVRSHDHTLESAHKYDAALV